MNVALQHLFYYTHYFHRSPSILESTICCHGENSAIIVWCYSRIMYVMPDLLWWF